MAIQSTGTPVQFTLSGNSVTVPVGTTAVFVLWQTYGNASGDKLYNFTLGGVAADEEFAFEGSASISGTGVSAFYNPSSGSKAIAYSTVNSIVTGPVIFVAFYSGVSTGWRDVDGVGTIGSTAIVRTIDTSTTDLVLRSEVKITSTPAFESGWTSLTTGSYNSRYGRLTVCDSPGASTTTANAQFENYSSLVVVSIPEELAGVSDSEIGTEAEADAQGIYIAEIDEGAGVNVESDADSPYATEAESVGVKAESDSSGIYNSYHFDTARVNAEADGFLMDAYILEGAGVHTESDIEKESYAIETAEVVISADIDAYNYSEWVKTNGGKARKIFICTLTGSADGTSDVEIPISSLQSRKRSGAPTYLSVVIRKHDYAAQITARQNGEIIIDAVYLVGGVESLRQEIIRAPIDTITIDYGPKSRSITLSGYKTVTYHQKSVALQNATYKRLSDGRLQYRFADVDLFLNPADELTVGEDTFTVGSITYYVSENQRQMDVFQIEQ